MRSANGSDEVVNGSSIISGNDDALIWGGRLLNVGSVNETYNHSL